MTAQTNYPMDAKLNRRDLSLYQAQVDAWKAKKRKKRPFILLGRIDHDHTSDDKESLKPFVFEMFAGVLGGYPSSLKNRLGDGCVVLDYWLPTVAELPPIAEAGEGLTLDHGWTLQYRSEEGQRNAAELRALCAKAKGEAVVVHQKDQQLQSMGEKLKEAQEKLAAFEARKNAK